MMSPELHEADNITTDVGKRTDEEQEQFNDDDSGIFGIHIVDSRDDLFPEEDEQRPLSYESIEEKDVAEAQTQNEAAANDDALSAEAQMLNELRQALLMLRGINRQLQRENDLVQEENSRLDDVATTLREENEKLRRELELLKTDKADTTTSYDLTSSSLSIVSSDATSSLDDDVFEFDERSHSNDLHPLSHFAFDTEFNYTPIAQRGSEDSDDVQDKEETIKLIDKSSKPQSHQRYMSDLTLSIKSRDTLYDIDELKITTTEDDEDVTLRMKLELKRDQCKELQTDLEKIAQAFWEQSEELKECQLRIKELQTENDELNCLKWVEAEVDAMWAHVKKEDKANSERLASLLDERDELKASVVDKSKEIAELNAKLRDAPCPKMVSTIQKDLEYLLEDLKASVVEKSNEIAELKAQLRNAPCPEWVQSRLDVIQEDVVSLLVERDELRASVADKSNEIAELKAKLQNAPCPEWVQTRLDDIQKDLKQMKIEQRRHSMWK